MGTWPDLTEYHETVQHPARAFGDAGLRNASIELDRFGMPKPATGGNAVVYKAIESGATWAVRCFLRPISDHAERYDAISKHLETVRLPYGTKFIFLKDGIQIRGTWYPVVKMQWVEGHLLHRYIEDNVDKPPVLADLRGRWRALVRELEATKIAHGDLQHGNILVRNGSLLLIDYDGMWVPALNGRVATELGHRAYQHPRRRESDFGPHLDRLAALVIYLSIAALEVNSELWEQYHTGDNLLFVRDDFVDAGRSNIWQSLAKLESEEVDRLTAALASCLERTLADIPTLETILKKSKKAKRKPAEAESPKESASSLPAWLSAGAPAALPILDQAKQWKFVWQRPDERVEVRWQQRTTVAAPAAPVEEPVRTAPGVLGRVTAILRRGARALEIEPEWEGDRIREDVRVTVPGMRSTIAAIQASADGARLAVVTKNGECGFWSVGPDSFAPAPARLPNFALAAFANRVPSAIVASATEASVWDLTRWIRTACPPDESSEIRAVALSPDGSRAAIGYEKPWVVVVDVASRQIVCELQVHGAPVTALAFSEDGELLMSGTTAGSVHVWRLTPQVATVGDGYIHAARVRTVSFAPSGQLFASGDDHGIVTMWTPDLQRVFSVPMCKKGVGSLCFLGERDLALSVGCNDGTIRVASVGAGRVVASFRLGSAPVTALAGAKTRPGLAVGTGEGGIGLIALR